jgi:DNA-binding response OmpR family regulator
MTAQTKCVFVVDDNALYLNAGRNALQDEYAVITIPSGEKLLLLLEKNSPDLILLDVEMPGINGHEALKRLKADARYSSIPVIFLTAKDDEDNQLEGFDQGAADYVVKPFSASLLIKRIEQNVKRGESAVASKDIAVRKPCVFAIDDSVDILNTITYVLDGEYDVITLSDPSRIDEFLQETTPDLFILDYKMPGASGFDLIPIIRARVEFSQTPIIFLTSEGTIDIVFGAASLGARDFIVKPFSAPELRDKIKQLIMPNQKNQ